MDQPIRNSERLTAVLSTLAALALLAAGVTAQQNRSSRGDELTYLESDLRFQLEAAYRMNPPEGQQRLQQLEEVLSAWHESPRTEHDRRLLSTWLLESMIRSMPGELEPLPAPPQFGAQPQAQAAPFAPAAESPAIASDGSGKNFDIAEEPTTPFVPGLTPDLAPPQASTPASKPPTVPAPVSTEHTLVSAETPAVKTQSTSPQSAVEINLTELSARIAGYHQGLSELETSLSADEHFSVEDLADKIHTLQGLANDLQFVGLYYASLSGAERQVMESPRPLTPYVAAVRDQIDRLQSEAEGDFLGEFDAGLDEQVAALRGQLDAIASTSNR